MCSRMDWEQCCLRSKWMDSTIQWPMAARALIPYEQNYHSTKLEFLALKWAVTEHFKEYLPYQPFLVKTDNNPLNLHNDDTKPQSYWSLMGWSPCKVQLPVGVPERMWKNTVADVLSQITNYLDPDAVRSILNGITLGAAHWAEIHDPTIVEGDCNLEQEVHVAAGCMLVQMHVTGWAEAQREDPILSAVFKLVGDTQEDRAKNTSCGACLWWRGLTDLVKLTELHNSLESPIPALNTQRQEWGSSALHSPDKCIGSLLWMDTIGMQDIRAMTIVHPYWENAFGGQESPVRCGNQSRPVHMLLTTWGWLVQGPSTPYHGHHSSGSLTCRFYQHRDNHGAEQVT